MPLTKFASAASQAISDINLAFKQIINLLNRPIWLNPANGCLKIDPATVVASVTGVTTVTTVTTVSTVTSVTGVTNLKTFGANGMADGEFNLCQTLDRIDWALNVRSRIT